MPVPRSSVRLRIIICAAFNIDKKERSSRNFELTIESGAGTRPPAIGDRQYHIRSRLRFSLSLPTVLLLGQKFSVAIVFITVYGTSSFKSEKRARERTKFDFITYEESVVVLGGQRPFSALNFLDRLQDFD